MASDDRTEELQAAVRAAYEARTPLRVVGGDTKAFLGRPVDASPLSITEHRGIISHEPTELVLTVRAGTPVAEVERALAERGQMLAFEPPIHGADTTIGGVVACGLSGPRRPFVGAVRDFILGVQIINGRSDTLRFGGEVMKNVAGYDASRLMSGAYGTLGVLLDVSFKVLPRPEIEITLKATQTGEEALNTFATLMTKPHPLSGGAWSNGTTYLRLSGSRAGTQTAAESIGQSGAWTIDGNGDALWTSVRHQRHAFFSRDDQASLWRLSLPPDCPLGDLFAPDDVLIDWAGAIRWVKTDAPADDLFAYAKSVGGHATRYVGPDSSAPFQPLAAPIFALHQKMKEAFDPHRILNPGRMYDEL